MGLLTDPRAETGTVIKLLLKGERPLRFLLYVAGIVWVLLLALPAFNDHTYFSENALLPGLVMKESNLEQTSKQYYQELVREMKRYPDGMPYAWLLAKMSQLHLDVFAHNFTLVNPFQEQKFTGQNIYGIVRAPRAASTEAIVVSVPFRPINSIYPDTTPSVALLLAYAKFCRKQKYWAKDIIFLVTEHEQLGMQAWLDAYHGVVSGREGVLIPGDLPGRAGSIQAALNLEFHSMKISYIDVKVEGLNGQLPNLDLFNLAQDRIAKEEIRHSFQRRFDVNYKDKFKNWLYHFTTLATMIATQATGIPTGNHGLFHRFGIEAITLEGFERTGPGSEGNFNQVGRIVETIVRSLNNLLERFHQSYFFYLLPSTNTYISIGLYIGPLVLIIAGLFIKAFSIWRTLQMPDSTAEKAVPLELRKMQEFDIGVITSEILWVHICGVMIMSSPYLLTQAGRSLWNFRTEDSVYFGLAVISLLTLSWPFVVRRRLKYANAALTYVIACVELATALMCIAMHNFSLALVAAVAYVPVVSPINPKEPNNSGWFRKVLYFLWILLHPFVLSGLIILVYAYANFSNDPISSLLVRWFRATKQAYVFSIMDSVIYGNWFYNVTMAVALPVWLLFWNILCSDTVARS